MENIYSFSIAMTTNCTVFLCYAYRYNPMNSYWGNSSVSIYGDTVLYKSPYFCKPGMHDLQSAEMSSA